VKEYLTRIIMYDYGTVPGRKSILKILIARKKIFLLVTVPYFLRIFLKTIEL
jgi:hypothetical protein